MGEGMGTATVAPIDEKASPWREAFKFFPRA